MTAGVPEDAETLRREALRISAGALEAAASHELSLSSRDDERSRRQLLHDVETLVERLAMCVDSDDPRWLAEYAEWIGPVFRRRGISLADANAMLEGLRDVTRPLLSHGAIPSMERAIDGASDVFRRNARLAGDPHKRNALWRFLYRGV